MLRLHIDPGSSVPIYQQIVKAVKVAVAKGVLSPGERMPTVRELAASTMMNPNTAAKAYQELEREGIIETLRSKGTFVSIKRPAMNNEHKHQVIKELLEKILVESFYLGLGEEELTQLMQQTTHEWYRDRRGQSK